jgi:hypothetical protein
MEKNKINEITENPENEKTYEEHIIKTINKLKENKNIKISGKILHYLETPILYYYCTSISNTNSNPFDIDIEFTFEFIDKETPYVAILTDFIEPSLRDNRNFFRCLTSDHKYKFNLNNLTQQEKILESMINGIENFLTYLNESIAINTFIFFGEYEYEHIYQINDFLQNNNILNFYRINEIINNKKEERYIIITNLYFLIFEPFEEDKALARLINSIKLKDINLTFDKNEKNSSLILKLSLSKTKKKNNKDIEFVLIDRSRKMENVNEVNLVDDELIKENEDKDEKSKYSLLMNQWFSYQDKINFKTYDIVLNKYKILFSDSKGYLKISEKKKNRIEEFNRHIKFNEKMVTLYENLKNNDKRMYKLISNIIYICSELVNYADTKDGKENEYLIKIRKYINQYK